MNVKRSWKSRRAWGVWLVALSIGVASGCSSEVHDTGYVGTWTRGNDSVRSTIAIVERDGRYYFRWGKLSVDGRIVVRCDWNGDCVELADGQEVGRYQARVSIDDGNGRLRIEWHGRMHQSPDPEFSRVEEAVVRDNGTRLVIRPIEVSGEKLERRGRPKYTFTKVSDTVPDPPTAG